MRTEFVESAVIFKMNFIVSSVKAGIVIYLSFLIIGNYPGNMGDTSKPLSLVLVLFGSIFYFLAPYMDAVALMSRRGSGATPNSNPDIVWKILGIFLASIGFLIWLVNQRV